MNSDPELTPICNEALEWLRFEAVIDACIKEVECEMIFRKEDRDLDRIIRRMNALKNRLVSAPNEQNKTYSTDNNDGLHTWECVEYAAKTQRSFCIAKCADARRARGFMQNTLCSSGETLAQAAKRYRDACFELSAALSQIDEFVDPHPTNDDSPNRVTTYDIDCDPKGVVQRVKNRLAKVLPRCTCSYYLDSRTPLQSRLSTSGCEVHDTRSTQAKERG